MSKKYYSNSKSVTPGDPERNWRKAHLVLIGPITSQRYLEKIQANIKHSALEKAVTIIKGLKSIYPDLINAYRATDCFILPSVHEPFGIVVVMISLVMNFCAIGDNMFPWKLRPNIIFPYRISFD